MKRTRVKTNTRNLRARIKAESLGDPARPFDEGWVTKTHTDAVETLRWFRHAPEAIPKLLSQMPRKPRSNLYEVARTSEDKIKILKNLFELHQGEIREVGYKWERVHSPMPWSWNSPWYNKQYQQSPYQSNENIFIGQGETPQEHWIRQSWGFSLMRLFDLFKNDFSAEVLFEYYMKLQVVVRKEKHS